MGQETYGAYSTAAGDMSGVNGANDGGVDGHGGEGAEAADQRTDDTS